MRRFWRHEIAGKMLRGCILAIHRFMERLLSRSADFAQTPAYAAAAAALGQELTIPEIAQSIVLTRVSMKSTSMPAGETLENFARTGATLAIHLGVRALRDIERVLVPHYGAECPVVVAYRVGWPDQMLIRGTLSDIRGKVRDEKITRTALILVGPALGEVSDFKDSALYDAAVPHVLRPRVSAK
jgi:precorrin-4/cobalt-precorrin-4 C11-methyltransferase